MAARVQELRKKAGFDTARQFASYVGISLNTYTQYESGKKRPGLSRACFLADALGCSVDELLDREPPWKRDLPVDVKHLINAYETCGDEHKKVLRTLAKEFSALDSFQKKLLG